MNNILHEKQTLTALPDRAISGEYMQGLNRREFLGICTVAVLGAATLTLSAADEMATLVADEVEGEFLSSWRYGVIGVGASGLQCIRRIAAQKPPRYCEWRSGSEPTTLVRETHALFVVGDSAVRPQLVRDLTPPAGAIRAMATILMPEGNFSVSVPSPAYAKFCRPDHVITDLIGANQLQDIGFDMEFVAAVLHAGTIPRIGVGIGLGEGGAGVSEAVQRALLALGTRGGPLYMKREIVLVAYGQRRGTLRSSKAALYAARANLQGSSDSFYGVVVDAALPAHLARVTVLRT